MKFRQIAVLGLVGLAFASSYFKLPYGLDLYDEPFYLTPGFKLMVLGDLPLENHILNGPRLHDILNYHLIRPLVPFSVLTLRQVALLVYGALLLAYFRLAFRGRIGVLAGLLFVSLLCFDFQLKASWSHNAWAKNLLLLHHCLLLASQSSRWKSLGRSVFFLTGGLAMGLIVTAYLPLLPAALFAIAALWILAREKKLAGFYSLGVGLALLAMASYLGIRGLIPSWLFAFKATALQSEYQSNTSLLKFSGIGAYILTRLEFWAVFALALLIQRTQRRLTQRVQACAILALAGVIVRTLSASGSVDALIIAVLGAMVGLSFGAGLTFLPALARQRKEVPFTLLLSSLVGMGCMAMASDGGSGTMAWLVPTVLPLLLSLTLDRFRDLRILSPVVRASVFSCLLLVSASVLVHQWGKCYGDVTPSECVREIAVVPYRGIRTSDRRAMLLEHVAQTVGERNFAVAYGRMPVVFMFGQVRSSVDTTFIDVFYPNALHRSLLKRAVDKGREPTVLFWKKTNGWTWGKGVPIWVNYPEDYPYFPLAKCASTRLLEKFEEFEAYETNPEQFRGCLSEAQKLARLSH